MSKRFSKCKEDFTCDNCKTSVKGNGYTDHCPKCLFSKHVDINPGDRKNPCRGLMKPIYLEVKSKGYVIVYRCQKCEAVKRNKASKDDSFEAILALSRRGGVPND